MTHQIEHICDGKCPDLPVFRCAWCGVILGHTDEPEALEGTLCKDCAEEVLDNYEETDYWQELTQ